MTLSQWSYANKEGERQRETKKEKKITNSNIPSVMVSKKKKWRLTDIECTCEIFVGVVEKNSFSLYTYITSRKVRRRNEYMKRYYCAIYLHVFTRSRYHKETSICREMNAYEQIAFFLFLIEKFLFVDVYSLLNN